MSANVQGEIIATMINSIDPTYQYRILEKMTDDVTDLVSEYKESVLKELISDNVIRGIINLNTLFIRSDSKEVCQLIIDAVKHDGASTNLLEAVEQENFTGWKGEMIEKLEDEDEMSNDSESDS